MSVYQEREQPFATGDRVQFTAPDKNLGVANRELGTIERISLAGNLVVRLEKGGRVELSPAENRHFDYGYAMTSHSAQGVTADRVLINADTKTHPHLVNSRFAYVAISRARLEATIYTNDSVAIEAKLGSEFSKSSALGFIPVAGTRRGSGAGHYSVSAVHESRRSNRSGCAFCAC